MWWLQAVTELETASIATAKFVSSGSPIALENYAAIYKSPNCLGESVLNPYFELWVDKMKTNLSITSVSSYAWRQLEGGRYERDFPNFKSKFFPDNVSNVLLFMLIYYFFFSSILLFFYSSILLFFVS
jgi:hypothetical protein